MSIQPEGTITSEQRGYRRGLILGLTMAESMLLLVFCLLLAAGAMIIKERKEVVANKAELVDLRSELEEKIEKIEAANKDLIFLQETIKLIPQMTKNSVDDWRELAIARNQLDQLVVAELSLTELIDSAELLKTVLDQKLSLEEIKLIASFVSNLKTLNDKNELPTREDLDEIVSVTKKLITHSEGNETTLSELLDEFIRRSSLYVVNDGTDMPHEWPPIINLSEADRHFFRSGSAELSTNFVQILTDTIAQQIADTATRYAVDVIEVIGHTDEQRMGRRPSNLDEDIKHVLAGKALPATLQPADNAGLGLARAMAVSEVLGSVPSLQHFTILPLSGAQLILPGDILTDGAQLGDTASRRRIEIRVRKRNDVKQLGGVKLDRLKN